LEFGDLLYQTLGQVAAQCEERLSQGGNPLIVSVGPMSKGEAIPSKLLRFLFEG